MKPPFAYYGGKSRWAPWIASLLPAHDIYVEPFCGSAAVLFAKDPVRHEVINDVDGGVVHFLRTLRDHPDELALACALTPFSRLEYDLAVDLEPDDPIERARRWWVRSSQGFGQSATQHTGWSISMDQRVNRPRHLQRRIGDRFYAAARRLTSVFIEQADAIEVIGRYGRYGRARSSIYVDPPYLASTRTSYALGRRPSGDYNHEFATDDQHRALAEALHATPAAVLLSGYHSPLYDDLYEDWVYVERTVPLHSSNGNAGVRHAHRCEVIWSNRPIGNGRLDFAAAASDGALER